MLQEVPHTNMDLIEEVRPEAPLFIDPDVLIETPEGYDAMWDNVEVLPHGIEIMKFSPKTSPGDVKAQDMPAAIRNKLDRHNIGKLWRARVNKQTRSYYEWGIDKTVALLMSRIKSDD